MLPCKGCAYRTPIPGNAHIRCNFNWDLLPGRIPRHQGSPHAAQWFLFPFNYDPCWGPDECQARSETLDESKQAIPDSLAELLSLLA